MWLYTVENLKRISPFLIPETNVEDTRYAEARRVVLRMSLGQDGFVGVKIAIGAVSASEYLSLRRISSNRLAKLIHSKDKPRVTSRASSSGEEKMETLVGGSNWTRSGGCEWVFASIFYQESNTETFGDTRGGQSQRDDANRSRWSRSG